MHDPINKKIVRGAIEKLIHCGDDFFFMKQSVECLYKVFNSITGIGINNLGVGDTHLPSGKSISPSGAAHCLLEMKRTAVFIRGIKQAIDLKIVNTKDFVKILYAGCGPYATMIAPLVHYYSPDKLKVTFLDINSISLNGAEKLINELDLKNFIDRFVLANAKTYKVDVTFDIVISETMQAGLKNEPQVAVMQNLVPQCKANAIFNPEQITIDAYLKKGAYGTGTIYSKKVGKQIIYVSYSE